MAPFTGAGRSQYYNIINTCIVDCNSNNSKLKIVHNCRNRRYGTGYYFEPDVSESRTRNKQREGKAQVPDKAIYITAHKLEPPTYAEGFDALYYVRIGKDSSSQNPAWVIEETTNTGIEDYYG